MGQPAAACVPSARDSSRWKTGQRTLLVYTLIYSKELIISLLLTMCRLFYSEPSVSGTQKFILIFSVSPSLLSRYYMLISSVSRWILSRISMWIYRVLLWLLSRYYMWIYRFIPWLLSRYSMCISRVLLWLLSRYSLWISCVLRVAFKIHKYLHKYLVNIYIIFYSGPLVCRTHCLHNIRFWYYSVSHSLLLWTSNLNLLYLTFAV